MTDYQRSIIGTIISQTSRNTKIISEEELETLVDLWDSACSRIQNTPKLTDSERSEVIRQLQTSLHVHIDRGSCVKEKDHVPWYNAAKSRIETKFWDRYRDYLLRYKLWSSKTVYELDQATDDIMDLLGDPRQNSPFNRRGLCIGDVQSGKTSTYIGLINKAADAGYKVIILLTGTIEKLRRQTQQRVNEGFTGLTSHTSPLAKDGVQVGVGKIDSNFSAFSFTSTTSDFNGGISKNTWLLDVINAPVIFVLKKNKSVLKTLEEWLRQCNENTITKKIDFPMLLIDDEADNASINTKQDDITAINLGIRKLLALFDKANYVGFTATPYANIFIDPDSDKTMYEQDLFPRDFIYALESSSSYIGARSIFADGAPCSYMLESNDDCEQSLPIKHKKDDSLLTIPESLEEAIFSFFIANTIRDLRGDEKTHRTMMINISRFIDVQNQIKNMIDSHVRELKREIQNYYKLGEEALNYPSIRLAKQVFDKYFASHAIDPLFSNLQHFKWDEIQNHLYPSIASIVVRTVNGGNAPKNLDYENYENKSNDTGLRLIAVGGFSLSRGLTLEGLCVSYYYRNSTMYDTLMQMGRWFGYRDNYQDLCKIWMPDLSMDWYSYISMATDELRREVKRMYEADRTPKDYGLAVRSDIHGLLVTARNKMRTAQDYEAVFNLSGVVIETRYIHSSQKVLDDNLKFTEHFLSQIREEADFRHNDPTMAIKHPQFLSVRKETVTEYLRTFSVHYMNSDFKVNDLIKMFEDDNDGVFDLWDVLIAQGAGDATIDFAGIEGGIIPVKRGFAYQEKKKSLQMSGKSSRLGSKDLAKGGLTKKQVAQMEQRAGNTKDLSESFYFKTGLKRHPLLVIYPVQLTFDPSSADAKKQEIANSLHFPIIGLSIGIPLISGKKILRLKYKMNKQKVLEMCGVDDNETDIDETDETIPEV